MKYLLVNDIQMPIIGCKYLEFFVIALSTDQLNSSLSSGNLQNQRV